MCPVEPSRSNSRRDRRPAAHALGAQLHQTARPMHDPQRMHGVCYCTEQHAGLLLSAASGLRGPSLVRMPSSVVMMDVNGGRLP
jgi:hypothetical protein